MAIKVQLKRNKENTFNISDMWSTYLAKGEPFIDVTTNKLYVGDGIHALSELTPVGGDNITPELLVTTINSGTTNINGERINVDTLPTVPSAEHANTAGNATTATSAISAVNATNADITAISSAPNEVKFQIGSGVSYTKTIDNVESSNMSRLAETSNGVSKNDINYIAINDATTLVSNGGFAFSNDVGNYNSKVIITGDESLPAGIFKGQICFKI